MFLNNLRRAGILLWLLAGFASAATSNPITIESVGGSVFDIAAAPSGRYIAFGGRGGLLGVMDTQGKVIWLSDAYDAGGHITAVGFISAPEGEVVVAGSYDSTLRFFAAATGTLLYQPKELVPISGDAMAHMEYTYDTARANHISPLVWSEIARARGRGWPSINDLAVAPNGNWLAFTCPVDVLTQWDTRFWQRSSAEPSAGYGQKIRAADMRRRHNTVRSVTISPDGNYLVCGKYLCYVYQARDLGLVARFRSWEEDKGVAITALACRPDVSGLEIALGTLEGGLALYSINTAVQPTEYHVDTTIQVASRPLKKLPKRFDDSQGPPPEVLAALQPVNLPTRRQEFTVSSLSRAHENAVEDISFSSDGKYLASTGSDVVVLGSISLYKDVRERSGSYAVASGKNSIRVWDVETGRIITEFSHGGNSVLSIAWLPDNKTIVAGYENGDICFWPMPSSEAIAGAVTTPLINPPSTLDGSH